MIKNNIIVFIKKEVKIIINSNDYRINLLIIGQIICIKMK